MTEIKQRAVSAAQKLQRIEQILNAAEARFVDASFSQIRLVDIAADVGITKAAFYRYFRNKELLFLALYARQTTLLVNNVTTHLKEQSFVDALTNAICKQPLYCKLTSILHTILEHNLTVEEAVAFKVALVEQMSKFVVQLSPHLSLTQEHLVNRFLMLHHAMIGAWANCHPSDVVRTALDSHQELSLFDLSFEVMLREHIQMLFGNALK